MSHISWLYTKWNNIPKGAITLANKYDTYNKILSLLYMQYLNVSSQIYPKRVVDSVTRTPMSTIPELAWRCYKKEEKIEG